MIPLVTLKSLKCRFFWWREYTTWITDQTGQMRFFMRVKSKYAICEESKIVFNKIETYTGNEKQYFWSDDA